MPKNRFELLQGQKKHWDEVFKSNPQMYGQLPSQAGQYAIDLFSSKGFSTVIELGSGQGRDSLYFLKAKFKLFAVEYSSNALAELKQKANEQGLAQNLKVLEQDAKEPLPLKNSSIDGVYSHMLLNMAFTTGELKSISQQVHRILSKDGIFVYTVRHIGDPHYGQGIDIGDNRFENGGFIVHFFDRSLVQDLATGFKIVDISEFEEGDLPRRLWQVTLQKE